MADLFAELHRRHPDVDLVILPAEQPPAEGPESPEDQVAAAFAQVVSSARGLWAAVAPDSGITPVARWTYAADQGRVQAVARVVDHRADGRHVLVALHDELARHGTAVRRLPGGVARVSAVLDGLQVAASYAEQPGAAPTLVLTVSSGALRVGADRAAALVRGGR